MLVWIIENIWNVVIGVLVIVIAAFVVDGLNHPEGFAHLVNLVDDFVRQFSDA